MLARLKSSGYRMNSQPSEDARFRNSGRNKTCGSLSRSRGHVLDGGRHEGRFYTILFRRSEPCGKTVRGPSTVTIHRYYLKPFAHVPKRGRRHTNRPARCYGLFFRESAIALHSGQPQVHCLRRTLLNGTVRRALWRRFDSLPRTTRRVPIPKCTRAARLGNRKNFHTSY